MAEYEEESPYEGFSFEDTQEFLYDVIGFLPGESYDPVAHQLFYDAMYNDELTYVERQEMMEDLQEYLYEEYELDFAVFWDWEDFREWYSLQ